MHAIHKMILAAAQRTPKQVAVECGDRQVSYDELNRAANRLANLLLVRGVQPGTLVGIFLERGPALVASLLSSLKIGAVFVPLDPHFPPARLQLMLETATPTLFITDAARLAELQHLLEKWDGSAEILLIGEGWQTGDAKAGDKCDLNGGENIQGDNSNIHSTESEPDVELAPEAPCYIFFTSGSTGRPKAILGCYKGLQHFLEWELETFAITGADRISQFTTPSFDAMLRDIFLPLAAGATICIPAEQEIILDAARLVDWIDERRITLIHCVPGLFKRILEATESGNSFPALRHILMAGERIPVSTVKAWFDRFGERIQLVNMYGASETTMVKVFHPITRSDLQRTNIPAGKAMKGAKCIVLDKNMNICAPGVEGEIYIRTPYMTLGYYRDQAKTQEVFLQNPFTNKPGDLIYKTGDLGRFLPDGNLEVTGRYDEQVKIRGNRVELGEIEAVLATYAGIKEVVVTVLKDNLSENYPVAYLVLDPRSNTATPTVEELRFYLESRLPDYMIPAKFVHLERLPLTPTGKIDRKALPDPSEGELSRGVEYLGPRNNVEETLVQIFQEVLDLERVGVYDNFFTIGGHSLNATRIVARIYQEMEVQIPLRRFFQNPTIAGLASEIQTAARSTYRRITPRGRQAYYPLSHGQRRLWILAQLNAELSSAYNLSSVFTIEGDLNLAAFEEAFRRVVRRHETMRTAFLTVNDEPMQRVEEDFHFQLDYHPSLPLENGQPVELEEYLNRLQRTPFDLSKAGLCRVSLIKLASDKYCFSFVIHHIISDAWSLNRLVQEVGEHYQLLLTGDALQLEPLRIQYRDYAAWQEEELAAGRLTTAGQFWRSHLAGDLPLLELPTDFPRPVVPTYRGDRYDFHIAGELTERLKRLATAEGVTLFTVLFSVYNLLLYRYSRQDEFVVGVPVHGRIDPDLEPVFGFFVNSHAIRNRVDGQASFQANLHQLHNTVLEVFEHQSYPFDKLVEEMNLRRHTGRSPLFDTMFTLQNIPYDKNGIDLGNLVLKPLPQERLTSRLDLTITLTEFADGIGGSIEYSSDLFTFKTMERFSKHYLALLHSITANPTAIVAHLPMLNPEEERQLLVDFNPPSEIAPGPGCMHQWVERWVEETPDKVALILGDNSMTYGELDVCARKVAQFLRQLGVGVETPVAILVDRSFSMVYGMLGVWKAGGYFIPISTDYPAERIAYILKDTGTSILLTHEVLAAQVPASYQGEVIYLEQVATECNSTLGIENSRLRTESTAVRPENLAYVIYTSGSTGKPKGVMIEHRNLVNIIAWQVANSDYGPDESWILLFSHAFDGGQFEIWAPLAEGLSLVIVEDPRDPLKVIEASRRHNVSQTLMVPGFYASLLEYLDTPISSYRLIYVGAEVVTEKVWLAHQAMQRHTRLWNVYGPTETTMYVTYHELQPGKYPGGKIPIGKPVANLSVHILDKDGNLAPIGVPGEICIAGPGLARGYLNQPELTAEKFPPHPFKAQDRIYRSGDLGRYLPDGNVEFLGRIDHQVKIRGYRMELGEIEAVLLNDPTVKAAAVLDHEDADANKYLVGYVVPHDITTFEPVALRQRMRTQLPDYMVPAKLVTLPELPVTSNGKVDRKALASRALLSGGFGAPEEPGFINRPGTGIDGAYTGADGARIGANGTNTFAPQTTTEKRLAGIWCEVLGVTSIGIHDDFFLSGGHSLKAIQVVARIYKEFGVQCPLEWVFNRPTIVELAAVLDSAGLESQCLEITPGPLREYYPLSHAQERLWVLEQFEGVRGAYNISSAWFIEGALDRVAFTAALQTIVNRHESLRTCFALVDNRPVQVVESTYIVQLHYHESKDLINAPAGSSELFEEELRRWVAREAIEPFDLTQAGLFRTHLIKLGSSVASTIETDSVTGECGEQQRHLFVLTMHHIISDGWSMGVLYREFAALYEAYRRGQLNLLPPLHVQYRDYAEWQNALLTSGRIKEEEGFWLDHLAGELPVLKLPTDYRRPPAQTFNGADYAFVLDEGLSSRLQKLADEERLTLFMLFFAAYNLLLYHHTGQEDIIVGTPIAGRTARDLEDLIGFFVNTLAIRTRIDPVADVRAILQNTREIILKAFNNQDYPFDALVDRIQPQRDLSRSPIFDTMFVWQNFQVVSPGQASANSNGYPGNLTEQASILQLHPLNIEANVSKFDLTLTMTELDGQFGGNFNYNSDLFKPTTIQRLTDHFKEMLASLIAETIRTLPENTGRTAAELNILTPEEKVLILQTFGTNKFAHGEKRTIQRIFEENAERYPDRVAVRAGESSLTYGDLNARANRLARLLQKKGVKPEQIIGIMVGRTLEIAEAILGVLKAGAAYLPVDPDYPAERIAYLLEDSNASTLVTRTGLRASIPHTYDGKCIFLDTEPALGHAISPNISGATSDEAFLNVSASSSAITVSTLQGEGDAESDNLDLSYDPHQLAYVIYTSGSTGKPKAAMCEQRNLVNEYCHYQTMMNLHSFRPVLLQVVSHSFDVFVADLCRSIYCGGEMIVASSEERLSPEALAGMIRTYQVNIFNSTPSFGVLFMDYIRQNNLELPSLQWLFFGGEPLRWKDYCTLSEWGQGRCTVVNCYGVTEAAVDNTYFIGQPDMDMQSGTTPIGKPTFNSRIYILNRAQKPVPIGVPGEIFIAGDGVGRGYLNRPELTAARFSPDPFSEKPGARMYRTGDFGRWLPDGNIEFLGRLDDQVKIRGFRIEIGEIETALLRHPAIQSAVVVDKTGASGEKYLVAYLVASDTSKPGEAELRAYLKTVLPDYMVPAIYIYLAQLPLSPNGKVDRRALPDPDLPSRAHTAPRNQLEATIAAVWSEVLGFGPIGIEDNFFDLGGNSLKLIQVLLKLNSKENRHFTLKDLMENPTIDQLVAYVDQVRPETGPIVKLRAGLSTENLFCVHPGGGGVIVYQELAQLLSADYTVYGIQARGLGRSEPLPESIEEMAADYINAMRKLQPVGPYTLLGHSLGGSIAYEMTRQLETAGEKVSKLLLLDTLAFSEFTFLPAPEEQALAMLITDLRRYGVHLPLESLARISSTRAGDNVQQQLAMLLAELHSTGKLAMTPLADMPLPEIQQLYRVRGNIITLMRVPTQLISTSITLVSARESIRRLNPLSAWQEWTQGQVREVQVPGNHYTMLETPHVKELARVINDILAP